VLVDVVMDLPVMQVSVCAGRCVYVSTCNVMQVSVCADGRGYRSTCNAGVCMCR